MTKVTSQQLKKASGNLEQVTKKARRSLMEFQTLASVYEIQEGKADRFSNAATLLSQLKKK